ncbi:uncharacterized protein G2W53_029123 [Senna tora]|uniref:Uncharacterized protein n=1 Tax=Senna tora TaxID=362788 RepID=A0A834T3L6_9FABA|nr:uncharacterized protein G2W53_029123 [Senna tora]
MRLAGRSTTKVADSVPTYPLVDAKRNEGDDKNLLKEREEEEVTIFDNGCGSKMKKEEAPFYHGDGPMIAPVPEELSTTEDEFAAKSRASSQMPNAREAKNHVIENARGFTQKFNSIEFKVLEIGNMNKGKNSHRTRYVEYELY